MVWDEEGYSGVCGEVSDLLESQGRASTIVMRVETLRDPRMEMGSISMDFVCDLSKMSRGQDAV